MTTDTEALRAQFEQYINPEGDVKLHWQPAGHYAGHGVQQSWLDFQAGHAAGAAPMSPVTRAEIAACLRALSRRMIACGTAMDVYGSETMRLEANGHQAPVVTLTLVLPRITAERTQRFELRALPDAPRPLDLDRLCDAAMARITDHVNRSAAEHQRQISPRGWRAQRAELMMRAKGGP